MRLRHMVIISIFSHGLLIESSTHHLPHSSQQMLFYTICPHSFTSLHLNNILQGEKIPCEHTDSRAGVLHQI